MGEAQVTMGFNTKSWSNDLDDLGVPPYFRKPPYLTAFGVFRRPPWKELSCKLQTALAQAQQEHGFCVKHGVCG